jgi:type IV pilus assembly protein PilQ
VIQVAPREELAAKEKLDLTSHQEIAELEELRTESFQLSFQKAKVLATMLKPAAAASGAAALSILSKRGSVVVDERTNTIFVQDTPAKLEDVRKLIKQIDVPIRQVMIEARIVLASDNFNKDLGVRLGYNSLDTSKFIGTNLYNNVGANTINAGPLAGTAMPASTPSVNLPAAGAVGTFSMMLFNSSLSKVLSIELSAMEADTVGKVISSPRVVTADQTKAMISTGTSVAYTTPGAIGMIPTTTFIPVVLSLEVTPQITPDDHVIIDVEAHKDTIGIVVNGDSSIDTNMIKTQALVENGGTVVIGGVYQQEETKTVTKVPLFGDIPVLGYLFRNTSTLDNKSELLIFITPKIMKDAMNLH